MKMKYIYSVILIMFTITVYISCEDENIGTKFSGDLVSFTSEGTTTGISANNKSFVVYIYHKNLNKSDSKVKLNVIKSATTTDDLFSIDKTELDFVNSDTVPITITINLNKLQDCVNYQIGLEIDSLSSTKVSPYDGAPSYTLSFTKLLTYIANDFVGTYNMESAFFVDHWDVTATINGNNIILKDMYEAGKDITLTVDPATLNITIDPQPAWTHSSFGPVKVKGSGNISICGKTITLKVVHFVPAGSWSEATEVLTMK
jgi:hypothetical protein